MMIMMMIIMCHPWQWTPARLMTVTKQATQEDSGRQTQFVSFNLNVKFKFESTSSYLY